MPEPRSAAGDEASAVSLEASAGDEASAGALEAALRPLLQRVGAEIVRGEPRSDDVPIEWLGETVLHVRVRETVPVVAEDPSGGTDLSDGLARLIADVEDELGGSLALLARPEKQHAVRLLEERGAFEMRRSAETVAEALGLTRFTVYNYLNRIRDSADSADSAVARVDDADAADATG